MDETLSSEIINECDDKDCYYNSEEEDSIEIDKSDEYKIPRGYKKLGDLLVPVVETYSGVFSRTWTRSKTGLVFVYSKRFSDKEVNIMQTAVDELASISCYSIALLNETQLYEERKRIRNYVYISRNLRQGCYSNVGMQGGRQRINLDPNGCINNGNTLHEMIHSLGYEHEQSRPDRDKYVKINFRNVIKGLEGNFRISRGTKIIGPYDFSSIMHYRSNAFARNTRIPTITSKIPGKTIPTHNGEKLSDLDIQKIKAITGCQVDNQQIMQNLMIF